MDARGFLFGFHCAGVGGDMKGFSEYVSSVKGADRPVIVQSVDNAGPIYEVQQNYHERDVLVFRMTEKDGENLDRLPVGGGGCYVGDPIGMAVHRWERIAHYWPPELDPTKIWTVTINEPSKEECDYDYLGRFTLEQGKWALANNRRYLAFGWSAGTPEPSFWENEYVLDYLRLCADHPDKLGVSLHEYSLRNDSLTATYPSHIGRFRELHNACDNNGIAYPTIIIGEFGWGESAMKDPTPIDSLLWAQDIYAPHANVKGAATWTLGKWHGSIVNDIIAIVPSVTQIATNYPYEPEPPEPPMPKPKIVISKVPQPNEMTHTEYMQVAEWGTQNYWRTLTPSHDDTLTMLKAGNEDSYAIVWWPNRSSQQHMIQLLEGAGLNYVTMPVSEPENPLNGLKLGRLFDEPYVLTSVFNASRDYPPNFLHEGIDVSTGIFDSRVLAAYDGVVTTSIDGDGGYGNFVIIMHTRNNSPFFTWYAHLNQRLVKNGDVIKQGTPIGTMGDSGNTFGAHLHLNLQVPGFGKKGYVIADVVDPKPYVPIDSSLPPTKPKTDMGRYFLPAGGATHSDIFILKNNWGGGDERVQLQAVGSRSFVVKNQQYEERIVSNEKIFFLKDTSPGSNRYYTIESDTGWIPKMWGVGDRFTRLEWLRWFDKGDCRFITEYGSNSDLVYAKHHSTWTSQGGITLSDVIELEWHVGTIVDERYFYAPHLGLVAWQKHSGEKSWISELIPLGSQGNNVREIGCFS